MARFDVCVEFVLEKEGGYVHDLNDPGGETKFGISKRSYPNLNIKNLTRSGAIDLYRFDYWQEARCGYMPKGVDLLVFDTAVNRGPARAIRRLQTALRVKPDGIVGPQTLHALQIKNTFDLIDEFTSRRMVAYARLKNFSRYGLGWTRRIISAHRRALV